MWGKVYSACSIRRITYSILRADERTVEGDKPMAARFAIFVFVIFAALRAFVFRTLCPDRNNP